MAAGGARRDSFAQGISDHHHQPAVHQSSAVRTRARSIRANGAGAAVTDPAIDSLGRLPVGESLSMAFLVLFAVEDVVLHKDGGGKAVGRPVNVADELEV